MDDAAEVYVKDAQPRREIGPCRSHIYFVLHDTHVAIVYRANPPERRQHHTYTTSALIRVCVCRYGTKVWMSLLDARVICFELYILLIHSVL